MCHSRLGLGAQVSIAYSRGRGVCTCEASATVCGEPLGATGIARLRRWVGLSGLRSSASSSSFHVSRV